jgi:nitrate reductase NapA
MNRREMLKAHAGAVAALAAGIVLPAKAQPLPGGIEALKIKWSKAPCRFCGTGCGVMVGVKDDRVVATHGDMLSEVNRGLNCVKGYFLSKIMYGADRLAQPMLHKRRSLCEGRRVHPVTWDEAPSMSWPNRPSAC